MAQNNDSLDRILRGVLEQFKEAEVSSSENDLLPDRFEIEHIVHLLHRLMFPGFFDEGGRHALGAKDALDRLLREIYYRLKEQLLLAFSYKSDAENAETKADAVLKDFMESIPRIQEMLLKDVTAGFEGDPAAKSKEEIIYCYPGFYAISVYRIAHELYQRNVPLIPRMMTEASHSKTGIDINPGATIGEYFFIDHGTGVVIGETTVIGNRVKLYQGVTLGALSTKPGQALAGVRRHPTVCDNVTVYAGATILGGNTVIGEGSVIGGNCFITEPIPPHTKVIAKLPELTLKPGKEIK